MKIKGNKWAKTKVICTIGPATESVAVIRRLIRGGMNAARLNFSHGSHEQHERMINNIRTAAKKEGEFIPIIQDLQGPKIRVGKFEKGEIELKQGKPVSLTVESIKGNENVIPVSYSRLTKALLKGDKVLMDDGRIKLEVKEIRGSIAICKVINGGILSSNKGVNLPGVKLSLPSLTRKDISDLKFGIESGVDYIALSFVRSAEDIVKLKKRLKRLGHDIPIIAKIEKPEAVEDADEIISEADVVMIARGDLGVEVPSEDVPLIQKKIIQKCNYLGKPVITATQMLDSMILNSRPTRAETSDVANAVLDGTDGVMLSGETSIGNYPVESVKMMMRILLKTEGALKIDHGTSYRQKDDITAEAVGKAACILADQLKAEAIVPVTHGGTTARIIAKYRPQAVILAATANLKTAHLLNLVWGVRPLLLPRLSDTDTTLEIIDQEISASGIVKKGSYIVYTAGMPMKIMGKTNMLKVSKVH